MIYILFLLSVLSTSLFAGPESKIRKPKKHSFLAPKKAIFKKLEKRITREGILLALVDSDTASIGTQLPQAVTPKSSIDWTRLAQSVTEPRKLINHLGD